MIDEEARELERRAREGDLAARAALERARARTGVPVCDYRHLERAERACRHLLDRSEKEYKQRFTGDGIRHELVCMKCTGPATVPEIVETCAECFRLAEKEGECQGFFGQPGIRERKSSLSFEHESVDLGRLVRERILAIAPASTTEEPLWLAYTEDHRLHRIHVRSSRVVSSVPAPEVEGFTRDEPVWLHASPRGEYTVVANRRGRHGAVLEASTGRVTMRLDRGEYHPEVSDFPAAFFFHRERLLLVHGTAWNRLDVSDPATGALLTERTGTSYSRGEARPPHHLDYFHGDLAVSPTGEWIADNGWVWHPFGVVRTWSLARWLEANPFESEDGPSTRRLCGRGYYWDGPLTWIGAQTIAVYGYGDDAENLLPAALVFDVATGDRTTWFAGPRGEFFFDRHLVSAAADETSVWDVETGERLLRVPDFCPTAFHPGTRTFATLTGSELRLSSLRGFS